MVSLDEVGLVEKTPAEIVLTTFNPDGTPHAATMGARAKGESKVLLRVFTDTQTFRNLVQSRAAVINVTRDVELLVCLALKDLLGFKVSKLRFERSKHVNAPKLKRARAFVEIEVESPRRRQISDELGISEVGHFAAEVKCIDVRKPGAEAFMGASLAVGSAILATKIIVAMKKGREKKAREMFHRLIKCKELPGIAGPKENRLTVELIKFLRRRFPSLG